MRKPLISVIMALFNEEQYIKNTVESILNQTYKNFELIIVDDYSTDRSVEICKSFRDQRIRVYSKTNEPRYAASSRNIAIDMAKGEYVIIHDADDCSDPTRFEKQLTKALEKPGKFVVGCSIKLVGAGKERITTMPEMHEEISKGFRRLYNRATIVAGTILASREVMQEFRYRLRFKWIHDWDLLLRMYESGKVEFYNCQEPLYTYYIRSKGVRYKPDWPDYNIWIRNCQDRRIKGLDEFKTLDAFFKYLKLHPLKRLKWMTLRSLISLRIRLAQKK